jgi:uncharacterized heparinase superfamily protein
MIQCHSQGHNIAPRQTRFQLDLIFPAERFDRFAFDQCQMAAIAGMVRIGSRKIAIAVAFDSTSGDGIDTINGLHPRRAAWRDVQ